MTHIISFEEMVDELQRDTFRNVAVKSEEFLRQAAKDGNEKVRGLLLEIVQQPIRNSADRESFDYAAMWLVEYHQAGLVPIFLKLLEDKEKRYGAIGAIMELIGKEIIKPGDPDVAKTLLAILEQGEGNRDLIINALSSIKAIQAIDSLLPYLDSENKYVKVATILSLCNLSHIAKRNDVVDKLLPLLDNQDPLIRVNAMIGLHTYHRELFDKDFNVPDFMYHWRPGMGPQSPESQVKG